MTNKELAVKIADDLFYGSYNEQANRLVLEMADGSNGGGWSREAVISRIQSMLQKHGIDVDGRRVKQ